MPAKKRHPATNNQGKPYPGVFFIMGTHAATGKPEKVYYVRYKRYGKAVEEPVGRQFRDDMTPAKANLIRAQRMDGKTLSNRGRREEERARRSAEEGRWTIDKLFSEYMLQRKDGKAKLIDQGRYDLYLKMAFGSKEPQEILPLDIDRVRLSLIKKKSSQTVIHVLNLLTWLVNFGHKKGLSDPFKFKMTRPRLDNKKTEDLTAEQLKNLLTAIDQDENQVVGNLMKMALFSGMRRGELFNLQWSDVDFDRGFISIRSPKGGKSQTIPMNESTRKVLMSQPRTGQFVFPGQDGARRVTAAKASQRIRERAGLPKNFRPFHGLRHVYASMLASSGKVDMYTLQRLMTHKSPTMTQRYAHLRDEALQRAADIADDLFENIGAEKDIVRAISR